MHIIPTTATNYVFPASAVRMCTSIAYGIRDLQTAADNQMH